MTDYMKASVLNGVPPTERTTRSAVVAERQDERKNIYNNELRDMPNTKQLARL